MKIFKIRNKNNGLFYNGGFYWEGRDGNDSYNWSSSGQTWNSLQGLRGTLNPIVRVRGLLEHWEIVELELVETSAKPLFDYINPKVVLDRLKK